jgi:hypothetical protein
MYHIVYTSSRSTGEEGKGQSRRIEAGEDKQEKS